MCGIVGFWNVYENASENEAQLLSALPYLQHRGPDAQNYFIGQTWGLGHRRLSIVDLSVAANQPFWNEDKSICLVSNNEIYNAPELRHQLEQLGHHFQSHSDSEVILHGYEAWGEELLYRLRGMFAFAVFDLKKKICLLGRDPLGIKPLHYLKLNNGFAFASEIKAFLSLPNYQPRANFDALHLFMNFRYIPNESTLFAGVERVPPGSFLKIDSKGRMEVKKYFDLNSIALNPEISFSQAREKLKSLLQDSVHRHLLADVEVAAYLSGGLDSSTVAYFASQKVSKLKTFCLGFGEPSDENNDARFVAHWLKTDHTDFILDDQSLSQYSQALWFMEEPKINGLQGFYLTKRVSQEVKVILSGLGGDELFAGYVNHDLLFPCSLLSRLLKTTKPVSFDFVSKASTSLKNDWFRRVAELGINLLNPLQYYCLLRNTFDHSDHALNSLYQAPPAHWKNLSLQSLAPYYDEKNPDSFDALLRLEAGTKMINDFLLTEDRVSMAHHLETRVPLLDQELVKFAFSLPSSFKYLPGFKKRVFRSVLQDFMPERILKKKKWGFSVNPYLLFNKELKKFVLENISEKEVRELGVFNWKWIDKVLNSPPSPRLRWHYFNLWVITGYHLWHRQFIKEKQFRAAA